MLGKDELIFHFHNLEECDKDQIISVSANVLGIRQHSTLKRVYNLANPKVIIGSSGEGKSYFRIHDDSEKLLTVLIHSYIK